MIKYPYLKEQPSTRQVVDTFKGYNHNLRIGRGEFYEMENLTSDDYPVLSPRGKRGLVSSIQDGGYATGMRYVPDVGMFIAMNQQTPQGSDHAEEGALFLLDADGQERPIARHLVPGTKSFALMGKYLIVAPDMKWVNVDSLTYGDMEYSFTVSKGLIRVDMCRGDGTSYSKCVTSPSEPETPEDLMIWRDNSTYPYVISQYSQAQGQWVTVTETYVRISGEGLGGHHFAAGDGVSLSGLGRSNGTVVNSDVAKLDGSHVIQDCGQGYIVIVGVIDAFWAQSPSDGSPISIKREVPKMDFILECGNRLWGCARDTNEIYACKLGDWKNWNCFQGLSTDSWVGSIGTPGEFTGAVVQNGYPIFYKETCKHKVWPSATGAHQITTVTCDGVQKGSESSLAVFEGTVFYKSASGILADDGGGAVEIGRNLGDAIYHDASGAIYDRKYYLNMCDGDGKYHLFVYDIAQRLWHQEDSISGVTAAGGGSLYSTFGGDIWDLTGNTGTPEKEVSWMAVTGDLGLELPEQKYISRLTLRLSLDPGATLEIFAQYDRDQTWVKLGQVYGTDLRSFSLPVRPRRCDQLRLKLQGTGMCKLYSITKTLEKGSELS